MGIPILGDIVKSVGDLVSEVIPDADKRAEIKLKFAELADRADQREHDAAMGQVEVNKIEAAHRSLFVAGWRPFLGWTGGVGLAMIYIVQPAVQLARGEPVSLDTSELMVLLGGLLGFGGLRSFDKAKGTANDAPLGAPKPGTPVTPDMPVLGQNAGKVRRKLKL